MIDIPDTIPFYGHLIGAGLCTAEETQAQFWDISVPGLQDEVLDDAGLRQKLGTLGSFWETNGQATTSEPKFVLITTTGDPAAPRRLLQVRPDTLQSIIEVAGFCEVSTKRFLTTRIPNVSFYLHYGDDDEKPHSMTVIFRCPRYLDCVSGSIRLQFSSRTCLAFISCVRAEDVGAIRSACLTNIDLLKTHPFYLLLFVYENCYQRWTDWFSEVWGQVLEIETATKMTHPNQKIRHMDPKRLESLSDHDILLEQLHATHWQLCHSNTVISFALKFGNFCSNVIGETEKRRQDLEFKALPMRHRSKLEEGFNYTVERCDSLSHRLTELRNRLVGQINVSYNLIAQNDSKVNLEVAMLQVHDSRTVKTIATLTLFFLPPTWVATLWTTGIFHLEGDANWQAYIGISVLLTLFVYSCWWLYVRASRRRQDGHLAKRVEFDGIHASPV